MIYVGHGSRVLDRQWSESKAVENNGTVGRAADHFGSPWLTNSADHFGSPWQPGGAQRSRVGEERVWAQSTRDRRTETESEGGSERDLIGSVTAITGVLDPLGTCLERGVHVDQKACIRASPELRGTNGSQLVCGLDFEEGGFAIRGFSFRADTFAGKDPEHAGLKEVDSIRLSLVKSERKVTGGGGGRPG